MHLSKTNYDVSLWKHLTKYLVSTNVYFKCLNSNDVKGKKMCIETLLLQMNLATAQFLIQS